MRKLLALISFFTFQLIGLSAGQLQIDVSASAAILMNAETGTILYQKNAFKRAYPASTIKLLTALYAYDKHSDRLDEYAVASRDAVSVVSPRIRQSTQIHPSYRLESDGMHMGIRVGEQMRVEDLVGGMLITSGNDAANVIAEHLSGSIPAFVNELDLYLKELGISDTQVTNPHGLHDTEHYSTPYDLARIARRAVQHKKLVEVTSQSYFKRPATNKQAETALVQTNRLLRKGKYYYPRAFGLKTGYTNAAKYNLVAGAEHDGRKLILVFLGCPDPMLRFRDASRLFDKAFSEQLEIRRLFSKQDDIFRVKRAGAKSAIEAILDSDVELSYYPAEEPQYKAFVNWNDQRLPIKQGDIVGNVEVVSLSGQPLKSISLRAARHIEAKWSYLAYTFIAAHPKYVAFAIVLSLTLFSIAFLVYRRKKLYT